MDTTIHFQRIWTDCLIWLTNQSKAAFIDGLWAYVDLALILKKLLKAPGGHQWDTVKAHIHDSRLTAAFSLALLRLDELEIWPFEALPFPPREPIVGACHSLRRRPLKSSRLHGSAKR